MEKLTVEDFKLGMRAARTYEELHQGRTITDDLFSGINTWEILAVAKKPSSIESYREFVVSDEYDDLGNSDLTPKIIEKLYADITPKKD